MGSPGPAADITLDDIRGFFSQTAPPSTPVFIEEITDALECSPRTARRCLEELVEQGEIRTKQGADSSRVWWKPTGQLSGGQQPDEARFSAFVSAVKDYAIFMLDPDGTIVSWNTGAERIKGYSEDEIIGEHFSTFYTDEDIVDDVPDRNLEIAAAQGRIEDEGWRVRKDGSRFWANVTITAIRDDEGTLQGFTKVTRDMTERREYEQQLEEQADRLERQRDDLEQELDDIFERIDDAFYALDNEFNFEYVNERAESHLGKSAGELLGRNLWEVFDVKESDPLVETFKTAMTTQEPTTFEQYSDLLGTWAMFRVYPSESGLSVYFRDITDRKEREQDLELFRTLIDRSHAAVFVVDPDTGQFLDVNDTACHRLGYQREEFLELSVTDIETELPDQDEWRSFVEDLENERAVNFDGTHQRKNGDTFPVEVNVSYVELDQEYVFAIARDITDRKERERELERTHELLEKAERIADVGGWEIEPDTRKVFWTEHLFEILEIPDDEEPPFEDALAVYHEDDRPIIKDAVEEALNSGEPFDVEVRFRTPDGEVRWLHVVGDPDEADGEVVLLRGAVQDITERKTREQELQRVRDRMEFALTATDAVVWDWNAENNHVSFYPSAESLYGTTIGTWEEFIDIIHPEDRQQVHEGIERALETGEPKHEEIRIVREDGVRWIEAPGQPVQDDDGSMRMIGVARDITERKTYEHKLEESNERLEQFAYATSHDLQEPLRMVSSYLRLIQNRYNDKLDDDGEEFIEFAVDGADRMREMIDGLLAYSRIETEGDPFDPVDLNSVLEDVQADLQFQIEGHDAEIAVDDLPTVEGDASQLHQLFQNLLENAIEYSGDDPPHVDISATRAGDEWVLSVCDEGIGIAPEDQDRIFEVFQRLHTQDEHAGTGIGLALVKRIVERHGGEIWVDSEPGEGTTFSVSLPTLE